MNKIKLTSIQQLELHHVNADFVTFRGRRAVRLVESDQNLDDVQPLAIIRATDFRDGVIETAIAGLPRPDAPEFARGFVGIAFRVQPAASHFEAFFLRPTNSRSDDQLRRNHSTQYMSHPEYPWFRLRDESPGVYESYTDLLPAVWIPIKIVVTGERASLYVNQSEQPCLVVNDLKLGYSNGQIALWIGGGTEAYFSTSLEIRAA
jgi:hypothetical protein